MRVVSIHRVSVTVKGYLGKQALDAVLLQYMFAFYGYRTQYLFSFFQEFCSEFFDDGIGFCVVYIYVDRRRCCGHRAIVGIVVNLCELEGAKIEYVPATAHFCHYHLSILFLIDVS